MNITNFEYRITKIIHSEKANKFKVKKYYSPLDDGVYITPITFDAKNDTLIDTLALWRADNQHAFTKIFNVTAQGTRIWLEKAVQLRKDRLLFLVFDCYGKMIGHLGVSSFDFINETCEIDNVVRGTVSLQKKVMYSASKALIDWIDTLIKPGKIYLRVLNDNTSALSLYHKLGFLPYRLEGLEKIESDQEVEWVPTKNGEVDRFFIHMYLKGQ